MILARRFFIIYRFPGACIALALVASGFLLAADREEASLVPAAPPLTVKTVLSLVEKNNDELAALRAEVDQARLRWKETGRLWGPRIAFTGTTFESKGALGFGIGGFGGFGGGSIRTQTQEWNLQQNGEPTAGQPSVFKGAVLSGQASAMLYSGGQLEAARDQAYWGYQIAVANYDRRRNEIFLDVIKAGLSVLNLEKQMEVAERAVTSLKELERITAKRLEAGSAAKIELLRVQAQLAQAEVDRLRNQNLLEVARAFLRSLLGLPADAPISLSDFAPDVTISEPAYDLASLRLEARRLRPEMKLAEAQIEAARAAIKAASGTRKPSVQISVSRSWFDSNSISEETSWNISLGVSWTLFDNRASHFRVAQAQAQVKGARNRLKQTERLLDVELDRALSDWLTAYNSWLASQKGLEAARENLRLARLRYETGFSTHIEVLDAERTLSEAEARFQQSVYDYLAAKASVWKAVGRPLPDLPL